MSRDIQANEVNWITQHSPVREQAFFTIMRQSGLQPKMIKKIRIKDVEGILEQYTPAPCKISIPQEKVTLRKAPIFMGEEAIKYIKRYLLTRTNLTPESLLFTVRNNPTKEINTKDVSRKFTQKAKRYPKTANIPQVVKNEKSNDLKLLSLVNFYRKNAKDYLKEVTKYNSIEDDEFYRKLYEEKALPFLEIEPPPTREITQLRQRLEEVESVLFPKPAQPISDPIAYLEKLEEWDRKNPEAAKRQREMEEEWERQRVEDFEAIQRIMKKNPEGLITYLQDLKNKIDVVEIIIRKQLKTHH